MVEEPCATSARAVFIGYDRMPIVMASADHRGSVGRPWILALKATVSRFRVSCETYAAGGPYRLDLLIAIPLIMATLFIRFGFLAEYPNAILHEDSGPYLVEAERLLEGKETADQGLPGRPPGYPLFLAAALRLVSTDVLHIVALQHVLAIAGVLLLTVLLRLLGVRRLFAFGFFMAVACSHRMIHYDNTIGAETWSVFMMSLVIFLGCGMLLRRWNPWSVGGVLGVLLAYLLLIRSASFFLAVVLAIWIALPNAHRLNLGLGRRVALIALIVMPPVVTVATMTQWNKHHYGRAVLSREVEPTMAFAIAYSGDFTGGLFPDLKQELRPIVEAGRAKRGPRGYPDVHENGYQWVFGIFNVLSLDRLGSQVEKDRVVSALFRETLLTPAGLYRHVSGHVWWELQFMLFDMTPVANAAPRPEGYEHFVKRDTKDLRIAHVRDDRVPGTLLAQAFPDPVGTSLQRWASRHIRERYQTEYRGKPGVIRIYSAFSLALLLVLAAQAVVAGWRRIAGRERAGASVDPEEAAVVFVSLVWLGNALVACTLIYALHRYSYYVFPFVALTACYALERLARDAAGGRRRALHVTWS